MFRFPSVYHSCFSAVAVQSLCHREGPSLALGSDLSFLSSSAKGHEHAWSQSQKDLALLPAKISNDPQTALAHGSQLF